MNREPFAIVVSRPDRLAVAGSPELVRAIVPEHAPSAILPDSELWGVPCWGVPGYTSKGARLLQRVMAGCRERGAPIIVEQRA